MRTPVPSLVLGARGRRRRRGPRAAGEAGWGAVAILAGVVGGIGAVVATQSGEANLEKVFVWSALFAATLRFATPLLFAALGGLHVASAAASSTSASRA